MPGLIVICGATATGKSSLALSLAERLKTVILSADSRQIYREFNIGTAKPTERDRQLIPHYLIDICEPTKMLTVADYQQQTQALIKKFHQSQTIPLLVGGTGLYIKSIVKGLKIPRVAPNPELRWQLTSLGQHQCYAILQEIDPIATQKIHANDTVRTLRALEVFYITGRTISEQQGENPPNYPILQIGLDSETECTQRIEQRTAEMLASGWLNETENLCSKYGYDLPLLNTLGYQEIKQYLTGEVTMIEAKNLIVLHTRQFAKRQRTWFKAYPQIEWFDPSQPDLLDKVWQRVKQFIAIPNLS
jgi:tRNA dimethylallyltransferase